jgi:large subunit ribosomal protein L10
LAITREKKGELVAEYVSKLRRSQAVIVTEYRGLTVKQLEALRRELRGCDSELLVAKNTLISRALTEAGMATPATLLAGPTAMTFCFSEVAAPSKVLLKYARDTKVLVVKGGLIGRSAFDEAGVQSLSELPGREQLLGQVVGLLKAPLSSLVNVLAGTLRGLVNVLDARARQLESAA